MELAAQANDPRDRKQYYTAMTPVRRVVTPTLRGVFATVSSRQVAGAHHLPESGPVVLIANHLTNFDVFHMQFSLPRPIFYMGKEELFRNPAVDWCFRQLGGFPVYRGEHDDWAIRHALKVLALGQVLGIFPEGSRSKGRGLRPGKSGAARLALEANCPIVPLGVTGTDQILRGLPARAQVSIRLGPALYPQPGETSTALTERAMRALAALLPVEVRGVYR